MVFRCFTTIVVAVITCRLRRLPKAATPQVVREYIILGERKELSYGLNCEGIAALLRKPYRMNVADSNNRLQGS